MENQSPAWIELSRAAIAHNLAETRRFIGERALLAVVKANAYGHGAAVLAPELQRLGVDWFGVARVSEALELRRAGVTVNILNMGLFAPGEEEVIVKRDVVQALFRWDDAQRLAREAQRQRKAVRAHIKVDTGLGRLGVHYSQVVEFAKRAVALDGLKVEGIFSVLAEDPQFDIVQAERFRAVAEALPWPNLIRHLASSAGILHPSSEPLLFDMVRSGIMLYGLFPSEKTRIERRANLRPVLSLKARVGQVKLVRKGETVGYHREFVAPRDTRVAILPVGYSDGLDPRVARKGSVLIRGRRLPLLGSVMINLCAVECTDANDVAEGDEAVLIGRQGNEEITADEVGALIGESNYKAVVRLSPLLDRVLV